MQRGWKAAAMVAVLGLGGAASAHELVCQQTVNGGFVESVDTFPTTVEFRYRITNVHPTAESVAMSVEDPALAGYGFRFSESLPLGIPVGGFTDASFSVRLESYEDCLKLAGADGTANGALNNSLRVTWDLGETQCSAVLICVRGGGCPGGSCLAPTTRDAGYFKTHEGLVKSCLASGPVDLGALGQVKTAEQALGLLWGSPALHEDGQPRSAGDALRFDAGRELLVATCNSRVYGAAPPQDASLLDSARQALSAGSCQDLGTVKEALRDFNASGTGAPQPASVDAGPATPVHARTVADDFTRPSATDCASPR